MKMVISSALQREHQRIDRTNYIVIHTNNIFGSTNGEAVFASDTGEFGLAVLAANKPAPSHPDVPAFCVNARRPGYFPDGRNSRANFSAAAIWPADIAAAQTFNSFSASSSP
jgi:hypothetical protein